MNIYQKHIFKTSFHKYEKGIFILYNLSSIMNLKIQSKDFCIQLLNGIKQSRQKTHDRLNQITDGRIIQKLRTLLNVLYPVHHLSYGLFIDGVSIWKSGSTSLFPVYLLINELNINERYNLKNMFCEGIIMQDSKPTYSTILHPMMILLQNHFEKGVTITLRDDDSINLRGVVVDVLLDMGERGPLLNMHCSGYFSCHLCDTKGTVIGKAVHYPSKFNLCINECRYEI